MKRYISIIFILILVVSSLGCLDSPEPPGADIPRLIVDYDEGPNETFETIIHLRGMEAIRFENMTLYLNGTQVLPKRDGYSLEYRTNRSEFHLEVNATRKERRYNFNATFTVRPEGYPGEEVIFKITHYDGEDEYIDEDDLPFIRILNLVEEEENT